jgi:hypothetical protein
MAWAIRTLVDSVPRRRLLDPEFDFDTCIDELIALVGRAAGRPGRPGRPARSADALDLPDAD